LNLKTEKELKYKPPSSPEDGEITEDETRSDKNDEEVRIILMLKFKLYKYIVQILVH